MSILYRVLNPHLMYKHLVEKEAHIKQGNYEL